MSLRHIRRDRAEMVRAILEAPEDSAIVVAVMHEGGGSFSCSDDISPKDQAFIGQVVVHDAMVDAFGEASTQ